MVLLISGRIKQLKEERREEFHQEREAWFRRQQSALKAGHPFDEPPPAGPDSREK